MSKNELHPGAELKPGQALVSPNGYYSLSSTLYIFRNPLHIVVDLSKACIR